MKSCGSSGLFVLCSLLAAFRETLGLFFMATYQLMGMLPSGYLCTHIHTYVFMLFCVCVCFPCYYFSQQCKLFEQQQQYRAGRHRLVCLHQNAVELQSGVCSLSNLCGGALKCEEIFHMFFDRSLIFWVCRKEPVWAIQVRVVTLH